MMTPSEPKWDQADVQLALQDFIESRTPAETADVLRRYSAILASDEADALMIQQLEHYHTDEETIRLLDHRRGLMSQLKKTGLERVLYSLRGPDPSVLLSASIDKRPVVDRAKAGL